MSADNHQYLVLVAGGIGSRLWPTSRTNLPKQFRNFVTEHSLLQDAVALTLPIVPLERTYVVAPPQFAAAIKQQLPELPEQNLFIEPAQRDTGPACAFAMAQIAALDPKAQVAMLWSDHTVGRPAAFQNVLKAGYAMLEEKLEQFICVGVKPTSPETGYGYIQMGSEERSVLGQTVFKVKRFVEKPDYPTALEFIRSWEYLWNPGYNLCGAAHFVETLKSLEPTFATTIDLLSKDQNSKEAAEAYKALPKQSIDVLLIQRLAEQFVLPADLAWSDVGSWGTLHDILSHLEQPENGVVTRGKVFQVESKNCLVMAKDTPIAIVGIEDIVIVDEGDVLLVINKKHSQQVKQLVEQVKKSNPELL